MNYAENLLRWKDDSVALIATGNFITTVWR